MSALRAQAAIAALQAYIACGDIDGAAQLAVERADELVAQLGQRPATAPSLAQDHANKMADAIERLLDAVRHDHLYRNCKAANEARLAVEGWRRLRDERP